MNSPKWNNEIIHAVHESDRKKMRYTVVIAKDGRSLYNTDFLNIAEIVEYKSHHKNATWPKKSRTIVSGLRNAVNYINQVRDMHVHHRCVNHACAAFIGNFDQ
jgi:hypothetical protein